MKPVLTKGVVAAGIFVAGIAVFAAGMLAAHWDTWVYRQSLWVKRSVVGLGSGRERARVTHYGQRKSLFEGLSGSADVAMVGDSLTAQGEWGELLPGVRVHNRGIGFDTVRGVAGRLDQICRGRYRYVFVMIGINDVLRGTSGERFAQEYQNVLRRLRECSGAVVAQSIIMPATVDADRKLAADYNRRIATIAAQLGLAVLDLNPVLARDGKLRASLTSDGIHLMGDAYTVWGRRVAAIVGSGR